MAVARFVVYPPDEDGRRRVGGDGRLLGVAARPSDVVEFLRQAGLGDAGESDLLTGDLVEWHGGGPETWAESPP
ncbi:hypothetical protein [Streptomyces sp. NPDC012888]|uniref:hypothetical protein n=1 Tax=Streptomyces sp. NPDC012888 TaxID=3364855 RepID=UPI0036A47E22